jgi:hypothetical protein
MMIMSSRCFVSKAHCHHLTSFHVMFRADRQQESAEDSYCSQGTLCTVKPYESHHKVHLHCSDMFRPFNGHHQEYAVNISALFPKVIYL